MMTEAIRGIITFGFTNAGLNRIEAFIDLENVGSWKLLEKVGCREEGLLKECFYEKNRFVDTVIFAIPRNNLNNGEFMKINILLLLVGLILTVGSKIIQFTMKSKIGDVLVIPAAISFVLAVLFSMNKFTDILNKDNGVFQAAMIAFWACLAVVSFQVMMILLIGHHNKYGWLLVIPFILSTGLFVWKWISI